MKICHSAVSLRPSVGILKQMEMEYQSAIELGLSWDVILFLPKGYNLDSSIIVESKFIDKKNINSIFSKIYAWVMLRIEYYIFLFKKEYDVLLLRYSVHDLSLLFFLSIIKHKVFLVHHTLEEYELKLEGGGISKVRYLAEKIIGKWCIAKSKGIVAVTNEILQYELSRAYQQENYIYPNGIVVKEGLKLQKKFDGKYRILFIASEFAKWHGLDLLLDNLKINSRQDFELHLIGKVSHADYDYISIDNRIVFHGVQDQQYILDLSNQMHIALGSFALYRNNMREACTLKVREYLSLGLPVYSGYKDVFNESFPYYQQGNPDIDDIILYANNMKYINTEDVIRESKPYIDKRQLLYRLYSKIMKV